LTATTFFDDDGVIVRRITHGSELDTFSANGMTLVGDPYHFSFISQFENGVRIERDVDSGNSGTNLDAFCAALS